MSKKKSTGGAAAWSWADTFRVLRQEARPFRFGLVAAFTVAAIPAALEMAMPVVSKMVVDAIVKSGVPSWEQVRLPFLYFSGLLVSLWATYRISSLVYTSVFEPLRQTFKASAFARLMQQSASFFGDAKTGALSQHVEAFGVGAEELAAMGMYEVMPSVFFVVSFSVALGQYSPWFVLAFLLWVALVLRVQMAMARRLEDLRADVRDRRGVANGMLADVASNALVTKSFAREQAETVGVRRALLRVADAERSSSRKEEWLWGSLNALFITLEIVVMYAVLRAWSQGNFTAGDVVLVQAYLAMLFHHLQGQTRVFRRIPRLLADAEPAARWFREASDVLDTPHAKSLKVGAGAVHFSHVSFHYKGSKPILKNFSLHIRPGEKVAFVGPSGAGKSTVIKLLYRFYDPQKGTIDIDGQTITDVTQESLRKQLSLVPQDPALFHRSILDNIRYARPSATRAEVIAAAKKAFCHEFISKLPDGYNAMVGERGVKLSGGERQRVAIARAILADTPILVLDEATSSLDSESEALIQKALHELMLDKTVVVIAHRLSTIMEMDRIVVIEGGEVAAQGTHDALLKRGGTYTHLWNLQSGGYIQE